MIYIIIYHLLVPVFRGFWTYNNYAVGFSIIGWHFLLNHIVLYLWYSLFSKSIHTPCIHDFGLYVLTYLCPFYDSESEYCKYCSVYTCLLLNHFGLIFGEKLANKKKQQIFIHKNNIVEEISSQFVNQIPDDSSLNSSGMLSIYLVFSLSK